MLCFVVDTRVWNATDPVTYNLWRAGDGSGMCAVCPCRGGGGGSQWWGQSVVRAFSSIIRIQHTTWNMQQMGSSLKWQLWACCHTELQLACQNKAAPRSFLPPPFTYSTFPVHHLFISFWLEASLFFPIFDPSILPVLLFHKSLPFCHPNRISPVVILVVC